MSQSPLSLPFQALHYAAVEFNYTDSAQDKEIDVPDGSLLVNVYRITDKDFDGTSPALTVGTAHADTTYFASSAMGTKGAAAATGGIPGYADGANANGVNTPSKIVASFTPATGSPTKGHVYVVAVFAPLNITNLGNSNSTAVPQLQA